MKFTFGNGVYIHMKKIYDYMTVRDLIFHFDCFQLIKNSSCEFSSRCGALQIAGQCFAKVSLEIIFQYPSFNTL